MLTENALKEFSLDALCELIILKLEALKGHKGEGDGELYKITEAEIRLLQHLINQKKTTTRPSM